jgi:SpoVK/Ycf46/Vps4 family AAA+-type ATPase
MPVDPELLAGLRAAVEAVPDNLALRLHVATLLLDAGRPAESLEHSSAVLAIDPGQREAVELADRAAAALPAAPFPGTAPFPAAAPAEPQHRGATLDQWVLGEVEEPRTTLDDVGGMPAIKRWLSTAFLSPLRDPQMRRLFGRSLRGGLLMYGPPGCGKTFLARAVAGELGANFFSVGLNDVLDMWLGESERRLHDAFQAARRAAPCVLFLDELDALGQKRSNLRHSAGRNVVNQLLAELDGAQADNDGVFVLGATNHPWDIDTALRRPGRLDRTLLVLPPDLPVREAILRKALQERPIEGVDPAKLARRTDGCSGADLVHVVETASEQALQESVRTGTMRPITMRQLEQAAQETAPSTKAWFAVAHNYALYANEAGQYDDLLAYIRTHKLL